MKLIDRARHRAATELWSIQRKRSDPREIRDYLKTHEVRKLQIGAGSNPLPGWLNTDLRPDQYPEHRDRIVLLDARARFPLPDMSFHYITSEHQIQCLTVPDGMAMLHECFRVLRPGGHLRISTPDLASFLGLRSDHPDDAQRHYMDWIMSRYWPEIRTEHPQSFVIDKMFHSHGHQFIYDRATLTALLADTGFTEITGWPPGESSDPEFRGVESHGRTLGDEAVNRFETMVLEAVRPGSPAASPQSTS
jgi:predicted SAM-dependent methyltransferase